MALILSRFHRLGLGVGGRSHACPSVPDTGGTVSIWRVFKDSPKCRLTCNMMVNEV